MLYFFNPNYCLLKGKIVQIGTFEELSKDNLEVIKKELECDLESAKGHKTSESTELVDPYSEVNILYFLS